MSERYVSSAAADHPEFDPRPLDRWTDSRQILGTRLEEFERLRGQPDELRAWLRDDANARALCRADVEPHLREWFTPTDGWLARPSFVPAITDGVAPVPTVAAVEWQWHGRHDKSYTFNNTLATGAEVVVRGCTVMALNEQKVLKVRRYIDWAGLLTQLGLGVNWRVPVAPAADVDV
jgi:hypothetical protein